MSPEFRSGRKAKEQERLPAVASGGVMAGFLAQQGGRDSATVGAASLTGREREVLQLVAEGRANKEIAAALRIGLKTVETHRANVMAKLDFHSVADLVRWAIRNGIISA